MPRSLKDFTVDSNALRYPYIGVIGTPMPAGKTIVDIVFDFDSYVSSLLCLCILK